MCITTMNIIVCIILGVMKMGNIAPRVGIKAASLAFWASMLTIKPARLPGVMTLSVSTCLCGFLPEISVQTTTVSKYTNSKCKKHKQLLLRLPWYHSASQLFANIDVSAFCCYQESNIQIY